MSVLTRPTTAELPEVFARWFAARGWAPRRHQLDLLEKVRAGRSALLIAPTGAGKTLAAVATTSEDVRGELKTGASVAAAKKAGSEIAKRAIALGVKKVAFDRNGRMYHGRVKALADAAREGGLQF